MGHRAVGLLTTAVVAVATVAALAARSDAAAAAVPPPIVVEEVRPTGEGLVASPTITTAHSPTDEPITVEHQLVNGTDQELTLELSIQGLEPGTSHPLPTAPLPAEVDIAGDRVVLAPDEAASVTSVVVSRPDGPFAYALVAQVVGADPSVEVSSIVVVDPADADVSVTVPELTHERVEVAIGTSEGPLLVDTAVRIRSWYGRTLVETSESDLLVWEEDPFTLRFRLEGPLLPGPHVVDVVARAGDGEPVEMSVSRWLTPPAALYSIGGALVILAGALVALALMRGRSERAASSDEERGGPPPPA